MPDEREDVKPIYFSLCESIRRRCVATLHISFAVHHCNIILATLKIITPHMAKEIDTDTIRYIHITATYLAK